MPTGMECSRCGCNSADSISVTSVAVTSCTLKCSECDTLTNFYFGNDDEVRRRVMLRYRKSKTSSSEDPAEQQYPKLREAWDKWQNAPANKEAASVPSLAFFAGFMAGYDAALTKQNEDVPTND